MIFPPIYPPIFPTYILAKYGLHSIYNKATAWLCLGGMSRDLSVKDVEWRHMLLQTPYVPFNINGAFTDVQVPHAMSACRPPELHRCWLLNFTPGTIWTVGFLFSPEDTTAVISNNNLKRWTVRAQHTWAKVDVVFMAFSLLCLQWQMHWQAVFLTVTL